jgi:uncharacterized protein YceH (UPF0502 family)
MTVRDTKGFDFSEAREREYTEQYTQSRDELADVRHAAQTRIKELEQEIVALKHRIEEQTEMTEAWKTVALKKSVDKL